MKNKKKIPPLAAAVLGAFLALAAVGAYDYLAGEHDHGAHRGDHEGATEQGEAQLYSCGMHPWIISEEPGDCPICGMELTPKRDEPSGAEEPGGERRVLYWRAPMDPAEIYEEPGKSKMGMELVPVYEDEVVGGVEVKVDPVTVQNMGVRTAPVKREPLVHTIRTYGHVTYDETRTAEVSLKFDGWIEKLYADYTGRFVEKGQPLFEVYSPALLSAQEEYLAAYGSLSGLKGESKSDLLASARRRLEYFDIAESEIRAIEASGKARKTLTIRSPFSGVVTKKAAVEGISVKGGKSVYTIADLSKVWVEAHIYEYELDWVKEGQLVEMRLPYKAGRVFRGKVAYVYPYLQQKTRDVVIRIEFDNPGLELKPEMYGDVLIRSESGTEGLTAPSEAVIRSGERNMVFVARGGGKFVPRDVTLGLSMEGGRVQLLSGVAVGEEVVVSGQFLLDSESKLKEAVRKMLEARSSSPADEDDFFDDMDDEEDDFFDDMDEEEGR